MRTMILALIVLIALVAPATISPLEAEGDDAAAEMARKLQELTMSLNITRALAETVLMVVETVLNDTKVDSSFLVFN